MKRVWHTSAKVVAGLLVSAMYAMPQYTISARPGVINYIEGTVSKDGRSLSGSLNNIFLNANEVLTTEVGKAEVLLTPGVFLRVGPNSQIRMISPSLTHTQFEVVSGEAMVEVAELEKISDIEIVDHGASITLDKVGLYRFTGDSPPTAAVLEGKATVRFGQVKVDLGKGRETVLADDLKSEKFDRKKDDDLYAWSNVRSEYDSAASIHMARSVYTSGYNSWGDGYGYAFNGYGSPGWYWNSGFSSYAWLPGGANSFYSPFGYGFFSPGIVAYAPVVYLPANGGQWKNHHVPVGQNGQVAVGVNPNAPPAAGRSVTSPWAGRAARTEAARSFASSGFTTPSGNHVAAFSGTNHVSPQSASSSMNAGSGARPSAAPASSGLSSGHSGGGSMGGGSMGGGGHAGGGGGRSGK